MNNFEGGKNEEKDKFELLGSQINLIKSNRNPHVEKYNVVRPNSALTPRSNYPQHNKKCLRPKSAEYFNRNELDNRKSKFRWSCKEHGSKADDKSSKLVTHFTDSSSKLLRNLLGTSSPRETDSKKEKTTAIDEMTNFQYPHMSQISPVEAKECKSSEGKNIHSWIGETKEEKSVRFLEHRERSFQSRRIDEENHFIHHNHPEVEKHVHCCCHRQKKFRNRDKQSLNSFSVSDHQIGDKESLTQVDEIKNQTAMLDSDEVHGSSDDSDEQKWLEKPIESFKTDTEQESCTEAISGQSLSSVETAGPRKELDLARSSEGDVDVEGGNREEKMKEDEKVKNDDLCRDNVCGNSTYEEIVRLLQTLEEEDSDSMNLEDKKDSEEEIPIPAESSAKKSDQLKAVNSYLEELEMDNEFSEQMQANSSHKYKIRSSSFESPRLEELLGKNSVELAHEVLSLKIQIEDQKKGIKLLKDTLNEMKETNKTLELEHQESLQRANTEAEALVQRHQKFIKQLLNEKKNLNETVSKLVEDLKSGEERHKRNMKALEEKHLIEIKRAKEAQAVSDKIKREKWMETKTQKIKEMTVKGLEPELSRMAAQQQEELTELRNLHRAELEAIELRAARRTSELMDQLRAELTKEKEHSIAKELANQRNNLEKEFEEEKKKAELQVKLLKERIRKEELKAVNLEMEFQQRVLDCKKEAEKESQRMVKVQQEKLEEAQRRHLVEIKNLRDSFDEEKEVWMNNYKKQQAAKFYEKEAELHQQYKRERDRDIEMIIETLEKESTQAQTELNLACENKMKRLKQKFEGEIKELEGSEAAAKAKLSEVKSELSAKEDFITELKSQLRQLQTEVTFLKKSCDDMVSERTNLKEVIKKEFESQIDQIQKEKENSQREMSALKEIHLKELTKKDQLVLQAKNEMQKELTKVYSRIKLAVSKKDKIIESLREENRGMNQRCNQLEFMLDKQRRNLLLQ